MPLQGLDMASVICLDANKMALPEIKRLIQRFPEGNIDVVFSGVKIAPIR